MRKSGLLAAAISLMSTIANADDIRWKPETLRKGDYTSINQSQNGLIHHVFRGKSGRFYVLDSYRGKTPSGKPVFTTYLDKDGNQVRWVRKDGFEVRFKPHDCTRTLGRCQYTQTSSDGKREVRLRITEVHSKGFKFNEYDQDGKRLFGGQIELDTKGNAGNGRLNGNQGNQRFRLVAKSYK